MTQFLINIFKSSIIEIHNWRLTLPYNWLNTSPGWSNYLINFFSLLIILMWFQSHMRHFIFYWLMLFLYISWCYICKSIKITFMLLFFYYIFKHISKNWRLTKYWLADFFSFFILSFPCLKKLSWHSVKLFTSGMHSWYSHFRYHTFSKIFIPFFNYIEIILLKHFLLKFLAQRLLIVLVKIKWKFKLFYLP